jgi:putative acetyltransferase
VNSCHCKPPFWFGLGPVAVSPEFQGKGICRSLVESGLAALQQLGAQRCVFLGDLAFYERFGFCEDSALRLEGPPEYFLAIAFRTKPARGQVTYYAAFNARS